MFWLFNKHIIFTIRISAATILRHGEIITLDTVCRYAVWNGSELSPFDLGRKISKNVIDWFVVWLCKHTRIVIECIHINWKCLGFLISMLFLGFDYLLENTFTYSKVPPLI
jgi:hypothetical protein